MKSDLLFDVPFPGHAEDAPPVADERMAIVCDGLGGAGGVEFEVDGEVHTCAYYASRAVIAVVKKFLEDNYDFAFSDGMRHLDQIAVDMNTAIRRGLQAYSDETGINFKGRKSGGSMVKLLPTTLASCIYQDKGDHVEVVCFWAGDSRCYALGKDGLHQLMDDDARGYIDAMECIIQDAVMNNVICLDHDFHISWKAYSIPKPCIVFAASDGCFAYLESPMSFESIFLPRTGAEFDLEKSIQESLEAHENDDRTLAGHIFGISSPEEYIETFSPRGDAIEAEFMSKMVLTPKIDELRAKRNEMGSRDLTEEEKVEYGEVKAELKNLRKQNEDLMRSLWNVYSKGYLLEPLALEQEPVVIKEEPEPVEPEPAKPVEEPEKPAEKDAPKTGTPTEAEIPKTEKPAEKDAPGKETPVEAETKPLKAKKIPVKDALPDADDELSPTYDYVKPSFKDIGADVPEKDSGVRPLVMGPDWTVPNRTVNETDVSLIMPYAMNKTFMMETRRARVVQGLLVEDDWVRCGDSLTTLCNKNRSPRNARRIFVKKRDNYDIERNSTILDRISSFSTGRFILPAEKYMLSDIYVQTFTCSQSGMEDFSILRKYGKLDKQYLELELCKSVKDLHDMGIVHGAISPESLIILKTKGGHLRPILLNFCDAFLMKDADDMERMDPVERGPWYDVYCLGMLFYKISVRNVDDRIVVEQCNLYKKGGDRDWKMDLISSMLSKDPSKRPDLSSVIDTLNRNMF